MAVALVLAAGEGRRLGRPKALVELEGLPFAVRVADTCRRSLVDEVVVVAGPEADAVEQALTRLKELGDGPDLAPVRLVRNEAWRDGRTGSLQCAWSSVAAGTHALIVPVDHPVVRLVTLDVLLGVFGYAAAQPDALVPVLQSEGERRRGHPIVLHARLREDLLALSPDAPLNVFVRGREVLEVPVDDEGILLNVNEPEDLERAAALLGRS